MRRVFWSLVVYESLWKCLIWMVLGPLGLAVLHAAIRMGGDVAVANTQLVSFALSPLGFTTLLVMGIVSLALTFFERAGLFYLLHNALHGRRSTSWRAYVRIFRAAGRILSVTTLQVGLFLVVSMPFLSILFLAYKLLLAEFDINYYLDEHPWQFWLAAGIGGPVVLAGAVVVAYLYVRWAFAVPVALFEGKKFVAALRRSALLVKGWSWQVFGAILSWELFRIVFFWLVFLGMKAANEAAVGRLEHADRGVLVWVALLMIVDMLIFVAITVVETLVFCLVIALFYENLRRRQPGAASEVDFDAEGTAGRLPRRVVFASLGVMLAVVGILAWQTTAVARSFRERHAILVTAHRAGAVDGPENTIEALNEAIKHGADFAELDVQRTKDGVVVVLHDKDLKRLTGKGHKIWDVTYAEVAQLDYVEKKDKKGAKEARVLTGVKIPTLEQFIAAAKGKIKLNIELKYYPEHHDQELARVVVGMIERLDFVDECVVTSLDPSALKEVRKLNPRLKTGYIVAKNLGDLTLYDVTFLSLARKVVDADLRYNASRKNLQIHAWGVETRADMEMMIHLGVDNLITDRPKLAMEVRTWYEDLSDVELIIFHFRTWLRS